MKTILKSLLVTFCAIICNTNAAVPRNIVVDHQKFVDSSSSEEIILQGTNVVMIGHPWIPDVAVDINPITNDPY